MDADLDTLCIAVYCTADDLLPRARGNARRELTDPEVVSLCVAQAIMGIPSDRRFLKVARKRLCHLFPTLPAQSGYHKRRRRVADTIEWLMGVFAARSPGYTDDLLLIDSTPVECARSRPDRSALGAWRGRRLRVLRLALALFLGIQVALRSSPSDGTPRALTLASPNRDEREVGLELLGRCWRSGGEMLIGDKGYAGRAFARAVGELDATIVRPRRANESAHHPHLAPIRQRIESIFTDLQGHPDPRTPRGAYPCGHQGAHPAALFWRWRPASCSTTNWVAPAAPWWTTSPDSVESII